MTWWFGMNMTCFFCCCKVWNGKIRLIFTLMMFRSWFGISGLSASSHTASHVFTLVYSLLLNAHDAGIGQSGTRHTHTHTYSICNLFDKSKPFIICSSQHYSTDIIYGKFCCVRCVTVMPVTELITREFST